MWKHRVTAAFVWQASSFALLAFGLPYFLGHGLGWELGTANRLLSASLAAAFLVTAIATYVAPRLGLPRDPTVLAISGIGMSLALIAVLLLADPKLSRKAMIVTVFIYAAVVAVPMLANLRVLQRKPIPIFFTTLIAVLLLGSAALVALRTAWKVEGAQTKKLVISASQHSLDVQQFENVITDIAPPGRGGAIAADPNRNGYVLVTRRGELYAISWDDSNVLQVRPESFKVPINYIVFDRDNQNGIDKSSFRVADILLRTEDGATIVYASHHFWKHNEKCYVVRVSSHVLRGSVVDVNTTSKEPEWTTVFESQPCLPVGQARGSAFAGEQIGGNLESMPDGKILLTIGDHQFDGWYRPTNYVTDGQAHYGKSVLIDPKTRQSELFTTGHRNPQGLVVDQNGRIWSTEHGPQGGDELNLLKAGHDYGYPYHSYGTEYGGVTWPPMDRMDVDRHFEKPIFSWVPSIGISDLIAVTDPAFKRWKGDLLIASMRGNQLWRVRIEEDRAVYAEPIFIGERIRDLAGRGNGEYVLWTDSNSLVRIRPLEVLDDGAAIFTVKCGGCHDDYEDRIGPTLGGLNRRKIAARPSFQYSQGLLTLGGSWSDEKLDAFLASPQTFVPGTSMGIEGIADPEERKKLIKYLRQL